MLNLDPGKLLVVAVVAIIVLGPDKLPHMARQVGGAWRSFGEFRQRMETQVRTSIPDLPSTTDLTQFARSPSALLTRLSAMGPEADRGETAAAEPDVPARPSAPDATSPHWTSRSYETLPNPWTGPSARVPQTFVPGDATLN